MSVSRDFAREISRWAKETLNLSPYAYVRDGKIFRRDRYPFESFPEAVPHADGTGSKGLIHYRKQTFPYALKDAFEMNVNDMLLSGALPYAFTPVFQFEREDRVAILTAVQSMVSECFSRRVAIVGGETEVLDTLRGMNIILVMRGIVFRECRNQFVPGDVLVGFGSNGLHANGFSRIRKLFPRIPRRYEKEFVAPTRNYSSIFYYLDGVHGMAHITGGGFLKLNWAEDQLAPNADMCITRSHSLRPHDIFYELYRRGVSDYEMLTTFNCGIGFVVGVQDELVERFCALADGDGHKVDVIGKVVEGNGKIHIESPFSKETVHF